MIVRPATPEDSRIIWEWRNDPVTISTSRSQAEVEWEGHSKWFPAKLASPGTVFIVGITDGPLGLTRFDFLPSGVWATSVNLNPAYRGKKLSSPMLSSAMEWMKSEKDAGKFSTEIKDGNIPSIKMFGRCGYGLVWVEPDGFSIYATS